MKKPARNKHYKAMPGHPEYVPGDVDELKQHKKRMDKDEREGKRKKKKKRVRLKFGPMPESIGPVDNTVPLDEEQP